MSLPIDIHFTTPPEGTTKPNYSEAVKGLNDYIIGNVTGNFLTYVIGSETPSSDNQDKAWVRLDGSGRPIGLWVYYGGAWRISGNGRIGEMKIFTGVFSDYFNSDGASYIGLEWDGYHICNGMDGTEDLRNHFPIQANGYDGTLHWVSPIEGGVAKHIGGQSESGLTLANVPRPALSEIIVDKFSADGVARSDSGLLFGHHSGATGSAGKETIWAGDDGNTDPDPFPNVPPFFAVAFVQFLGLDASVSPP